VIPACVGGRSRMARDPGVLVGSGRGGVAVQTPRHEVARNQALDQPAACAQRCSWPSGPPLISFSVLASL
jgi:hypothetical protein